MTRLMKEPRKNLNSTFVYKHCVELKSSSKFGLSQWTEISLTGYEAQFDITQNQSYPDLKYLWSC